MRGSICYIYSFIFNNKFDYELIQLINLFAAFVLILLIFVISCSSVSHKLVSGKEGVIEVRTGTTPAISKNRQSGHLLVVRNSK